MMSNLSGFKNFFELACGPTTRPDQQDFGHGSGGPDQQAYGHGKDGTMDALSTQAMELDTTEKMMGSVPWAGANIQIGHKIMGGNSSIEVLDITNKTVTLRVSDNGSKRFIKTPGALYNDPTPRDPKIITVPRAYFVKMCSDQYGGASGAMAGPPGGGGGGLPPMM